MRITSYIARALLIGLFATGAHAQQSDPAPDPDTGSTPAQNEPASTILDEGAALRRNPFRHFQTKERQFGLAAQVVQVFDDNLFGSKTDKITDQITRASVLAGMSLASQHTSFVVHYTPEYSMYRRFDSLDFVSHSYDQTLLHDFSRHTHLDWRSNAAYYPSRGGVPSLPGGLGAFGFAMPSIEQLAKDEGFKVLDISSTAGVVHDFNARDTGRLEGSFSLTKYTPESPMSIANTLARQTEISGLNAGWEREINSGRHIGALVTAVYLRYLGPNSHEYHESAEVTFRQRLPKRFAISLGAGPQFNERRGIPATAGYEPAYALDAALTRDFSRSQLALGYRRALQVGLAEGSLTAHDAYIAWHEGIGRRGFLNLSGNYQHSDGLNGARRLESYFATAQAGYRLSPIFILFCNFAHSQQHSVGMGDLAYAKNQYAIGVAYDFSEKLGGTR